MAKRDGFFRDIMNAAKTQGWRIERTSKGHWQFIPPVKGQPIVVTSGTPSDHRETKNFLSDMRRSGLDMS